MSRDIDALSMNSGAASARATTTKSLNLRAARPPINGAAQPPRPVTAPVRVALVDRDPALHAAVSAVVGAMIPRWVLMSYFNPRDVPLVPPTARPDVLALELRLSDPCAFAATLKLMTARQRTPLLVLADRAEVGDILLSLKAGARGFFGETL